jgi:hypothetical protein
MLIWKITGVLSMDPQSYTQLRQEIADRIAADSVVLEQIRSEIRPLRNEVRRILPRATTAISLVAADGGNNSLQFDPFLIHIVRIVDSSNKEYCLEAITPTTSIADLSKKQFNLDGSPQTRLGGMMEYLDVKDLTQLSHMIRSDHNDQATSLSWVQVYRELVEWAALFSIIRDQVFSSDTLIVCDGLLRTKVFAHDLFSRYCQGIRASIEEQRRNNRRRIYLVGVAKHSKVLTRYRLAMALEKILTTSYPAYLPIPRTTEASAYVWSEYANREDLFVAGKMFFVKFGSGPRDPIWPVDIFLSQENEAAQILGYMLADANNGFPVPLYPQCLQKAHENAALVNFDFDIFQNYVFDGIRQILDTNAAVLDVFRLQTADPSQRRYE